MQEFLLSKVELPRVTLLCSGPVASPLKGNVRRPFAGEKVSGKAYKEGTGLLRFSLFYLLRERKKNRTVEQALVLLLFLAEWKGDDDAGSVIYILSRV